MSAPTDTWTCSRCQRGAGEVTFPPNKRSKTGLSYYLSIGFYGACPHQLPGE